jgi:hypothetical protein
LPFVRLPIVACLAAASVRTPACAAGVTLVSMARTLYPLTGEASGTAVCGVQLT